MNKIEYIGLIIVFFSFTLLILNIALISVFKSKYNSLLNMILSVSVSVICILYLCFFGLSKYSCFFTFMSISIFILNILIEFILRKGIHKAFKNILQRHSNIPIHSRFYITNTEIYIANDNELFVLNLVDNSEENTIFEKNTEKWNEKIFCLIKRNYYFRLF